MADYLRHTGILNATEPEAPADKAEIEPPIDRRQARMAALRRVAGIWACRTDIPADGLLYERKLRDEWR